ncbi:hypothetical protein [Cellulomonas sp. ATA003]|uniref:hypothetical protein n=1 Tax=Cellulomonas sp. ATA003 TaxID=3073064 RepID=UPI002872CFF0|nr:hypothetical protein [Cellulomonas sp. ATA003]WNB84323.1 hypothetical protein REH70_10550 [Cellulomonas sp. ATA003]
MTWDVYALRPPRGARSVEEFPDGYTPPSIGDPDVVVAKIREVAPHLDDAGRGWLRLNGPDHEIEIAIGKGLGVQEVTFYIHGGDGAVGVVLDVSRALGVVPYDTETGGVLNDSSQPPSNVPPPPGEDDDEPRPWWRRLLGR